MPSSSEMAYPPLMQAQLAALDAYARAHGTQWRDDLLRAWDDDTAPALLLHLRQSHGRVWLSRVAVTDS